jgi:hypothetical protein
VQTKSNNISHKKAQKAQKGTVNSLRVLSLFAANIWSHFGLFLISLLAKYRPTVYNALSLTKNQLEKGR